MSGTIEFGCQHCGCTVRAQARHIGQNASCPGCGKSIVIEGDVQEVGAVMEDNSASKPETTDVNVVVTGLIGAAATVGLYVAIFFPLRETLLGELFTDRGKIPGIATFVTCWGMAILALKYISVNRQVGYAERELELMPLEAGMQITPDNSEKVLKHLSSLSHSLRESILGRRVHGALEHFRARASVPEVQSYLSSQSEIDASRVESGYTLLRVFIWAVPILGFIGTVLGISSAVGGLADALAVETMSNPPAVAGAEVVGSENLNDEAGGSQESQEEGAGLGERMVQAMGIVTQGLATAFDTTFLALVMAILLMFPTEALRKTEYAMLDRIETFTNQCLLRRMSDKSGDKRIPRELVRVLEPAFQEHQRWLVQWQQQVAELGNAVGRDLDRHVAQIEARIGNIGRDRLAEATGLTNALQSTADTIGQQMEQWCQATGSIAQNLEAVATTTDTLRSGLLENAREMKKLGEEFPKPQVRSVNELVAAVESLVAQFERISSEADGNNGGASDVHATSRSLLSRLLGGGASRVDLTNGPAGHRSTVCDQTTIVL